LSLKGALLQALSPPPAAPTVCTSTPRAGGVSAKTLAVARSLMRGHLDEVVKQIDSEATHFRDLLQSDEARAAFTAFLARRK
jgi:hypothetical protein